MVPENTAVMAQHREDFVKSWKEDVINQLHSSRDEAELFKNLAGIAKGLGYDHCSYGMCIPVPVSRPTFVVFNNYPAAWWEMYEKNNFRDIDPTVKHGFVSAEPLIWTPEVFAGIPGMWEGMEANGLTHGWAKSSRDNMGTMGLLSLARSSQGISKLELQESELQMFWLGQMAHEGMSARIIRDNNERLNLTIREREVLLWSAEGKTAFEIGKILSISAATVNFHVNNAVAKLGAVNKIQAVVKAAMLGLLNFSMPPNN